MEWHVFLINALPHKLNCATPPQNPDVFIHRHFVAGREELTFTEIVQCATCDTNSEQSEAFSTGVARRNVSRVNHEMSGELCMWI